MKKIRKLFIKFPILFPSFAASLLYIFIAIFYISPKYSSESIISVSSGDSQSVSSALGFVSSFLGSGISQSIGDLKAYLESDNAATDIQKLVDINDIFSSHDIDFFSRYRPESKQEIKEYLSKVITLKADESGNLIIETYAYKPKDAYILNLAVILLSSNYYDKRQNLSSKIAIQKHICQYQMSKNGFPAINLEKILNSNDENQKDLIDVNQFESANSMLLNKAESFSNACNSDIDNLRDTIDIPSNTIRDFNNESLKQLIGNIYSNSISAMTMSDAIEILAEPSLNTKTESKEVFINSVIFFLFCLLLSTTIQILYKLRNDFRF